MSISNTNIMNLEKNLKENIYTEPGDDNNTERINLERVLQDSKYKSMN